jgi:CBS domain-containing protein
MYDDVGIKTQINNPYKVKKLESIASSNKNSFHLNEDYEHPSHKKRENQSEAKNAYKKIANIHMDEEILHTYQLMNKKVISLLPDESIALCWKKMNDNDMKQMAVIRDDGKLVGLATMKNILNAMIKNKENTQYIDEAVISEVMIKNIITTDPITDIRKVAKVMIKYQLNSIPVVDSKTDETVGIVTRADILMQYLLPHIFNYGLKF